MLVKGATGDASTGAYLEWIISWRNKPQSLWHCVKYNLNFANVNNKSDTSEISLLN